MFGKKLKVYSLNVFLHIFVEKTFVFVFKMTEMCVHKSYFPITLYTKPFISLGDSGI